MVRIPAESLAAFLDGTLSEGERAAVIREMARSPEAYAEFLEAQAIDGALREPVRVAAPTAAPARGARRWARIAAIPALLAAAAAVYFLRPQRDAAPIAELAAHPPALATDGRTLAARFGETWTEPGWTNVRGGEDALGAEARAFRIGARLASLEFAVAATDTSASRDIVRRLAALLRSGTGGAPLASLLEAMDTSGSLFDEGTRTAFARQVRAANTAANTAAFVDLGTCLDVARLGLVFAIAEPWPGAELARGCAQALRAQHFASASPDWEATLRAARELYATDERPPVATRTALVRAAFDSAPR